MADKETKTFLEGLLALLLGLPKVVNTFLDEASLGHPKLTVWVKPTFWLCVTIIILAPVVAMAVDSLSPIGNGIAGIFQWFSDTTFLPPDTLDNLVPGDTTVPGEAVASPELPPVD